MTTGKNNMKDKIAVVLKRTISIVCILAIVLACVPVSSAAESIFEPNVDLKSEAVYMVNTDTNTVVYAKNQDAQIVPASLVKMMTVIIALEQADPNDTDTFLNQTVTAKPYIFDRLYGLNASSADIRPNETLPLKDVFYASMLPSACEATMILADFVDGSNTDAFVQRMNDKAKSLGMDNTVFVDPDGLDETTQRSTAKDMYTLTAYCMQNPVFKEMATSQQYTMSATNKHSQERIVQHTNHMMSRYLGGKYYDSRVKGIKTGTAAGIKNLISSAEDGNYHYTLVTMGAPDTGDSPTYSDAENLYNWAFDNLKFVTVGKPGEKVIPNSIKVNVGKGTDSVILTPKEQVVELLPKSIDSSAVIWDTSSLPAQIDAPIKQGQTIGQVSLKLSGTVLGTVDVVADKEIKLDVFAFIIRLLKDIFTSWIFWLILIAVAIMFVYRNFRKKASFKKARKTSARRQNANGRVVSSGAKRSAMPKRYKRRRK